MFKVKTGSFLTLAISCADIKPITQPRITAPSVSYRKSFPMKRGGGILPFTNYKLIVYKIIHEPSLSKLSPSINELNFRGAPAYLRSASTATVSVQESTDPNIKASGHV